MKTNTKIIIDKIIGTPLVYLINILARITGFLLKIDHNLDKSFKTIVISKYVGLGSIIQATPLIQTLRKKYPGAEIIFITTSGNEILLNYIPEVDKTFTIRDKNIFQVISSSVQLLLKLWKIKPDLFLDLEYYSNYGSIITTLSLAKNRIGFYQEGKIYRKGVYNYLVPFNVDFPISSTYLQFSQLLKIKEEITKIKIEVDKNAHWEEISGKIKLEPSQKYIVVNPNASDLRLERRWPKEYYVDVINKFLSANKEIKVVLIGDKYEKEYVGEIESKLNTKENVINSSGKLNLSELIVLISNAQLMLTNDTGPMHIAFATGTKTISLFGPCSPKQYGGIDNSVTFYKKVSCSPCVHKYLIPPCHGDNQCMKQITKEEVLESLLGSLPV